MQNPSYENKANISLLLQQVMENTSSLQHMIYKHKAKHYCFANYMLEFHDQLMTQASHTCHEFITHTWWSSLHQDGHNTPAMKIRSTYFLASKSDGKHIITITLDLQR